MAGQAQALSFLLISTIFGSYSACQMEQCSLSDSVNPIALKRVERLYCKNERAVIDCQLTGSGASLTLVPVAAILVASIKLNFLDDVLDLKYKGPNRISCAAAFSKGQEMGYFQHGSTIIVFASRDFTLVPNITEGSIIRMGQPLLQYP